MTLKISDIARYANVSPSTVSRVIREYPHVSREKRDRVLRALDELNYMPNKVAQGLKSKKTGVIGHILPHTFPNPFFANISLGVDEEAYESGYRVLTMASYLDSKRESQHVMDLASRMVDGIVFSGPVAKKNVDTAVNLGIPVVMVERRKNIESVDRVILDDLQGAYTAVQHMASLNHTKIGFIGPHPSFDSVECERYEGYVKAMNDNRLKIDGRFVKHVANYPYTYGYTAMREMIQDDCLPSALFITSDYLAIGVLQALYEANIRIPDDISIVSYDNSYGGMLNPPLSTIGAPMYELGQSAVRLLLQRSEQLSAALRTVQINTTFIDRGSVRRI